MAGDGGAPSDAAALLASATATLRERTADLAAARLEAELLLAHVLGVGRERLLTLATVPAPAAQAFERDVAERARTGRPVAYFVGRRGFLEFELAVDARVLVPRPESELIIEVLDELLASGALPRGPLVDRGTGSGNLALGVRGRRPVLALDVSVAALEVAAGNLSALLPRARRLLVRADGLSCLRPASVAAVLANPPYVEPDEFARLPDDVRRHEPAIALVPGEGSARAMFTRLLGEARAVLRPGGWLITEVGAGQAPWVAELASVLGFGWTDVRRDLAGIERVVAARR
ncbi:MAG TPA: HemK/PrmC family methyltransferase [Planctomycetota bacterium]|nr:HemK/PrmC family methyltransferase [Planctomycetota bacterium]